MVYRIVLGKMKCLWGIYIELLEMFRLVYGDLGVMYGHTAMNDLVEEDLIVLHGDGGSVPVSCFEHGCNSFLVCVSL